MELRKALKIGAIGTVFAGALGLVFKMFESPRQKIVRIAKTQLGEQDPSKYWKVVAPDLVGTTAAWCGGFALWALKQAGLLANLDWTVGKGFLFKANNGKSLPTTHDPKPGDIVYFDAPFQHHAIVESIDGDTLHTIDGNQSPGEQVKLRTRNKKEATAFYSIEPLLS